MHLPVRCFIMEKSIWSSKNMNWSTDCISYSVNGKRNSFKCWGKNGVSGNCPLGKVKKLLDFFKPSCLTLKLHFSKHPEMLRLVPLTCWYPAQTFIKQKKGHRKQEKLESSNTQDILPSNSSSPFWYMWTWLMLVPLDWGPENNHIPLLKEKNNQDPWSTLLSEEYQLNLVTLSPVHVHKKILVRPCVILSSFTYFNGILIALSPQGYRGCPCTQMKGRQEAAASRWGWSQPSRA